MGVCPSTDMMNNLLQVTVIARVVNATVECRFQSGFIGSARCRIDYGSDSRNPAYSDESSESGSAGDTVTILLSQTLDPNTTYYYSVYTIGATETNVQSQGSFRSGRPYSLASYVRSRALLSYVHVCLHCKLISLLCTCIHHSMNNYSMNIITQGRCLSTS